jgi:hypothetical protein
MMSSRGHQHIHGRIDCSVTDTKAEAGASVASVCGISRDTVQYTFRMEMVDENSIVFHNSPVNELCDGCQAFNFKAESTAGHFTSCYLNGLVYFP